MKTLPLFVLVIASAAIASLSSAQTLFAPGAVVGNSGNGNVGIGTSIPAAKLHVGGSNQEIRFDYNGSNAYYGSLRWGGLQLGNNGSNRIVAGRSQLGGLLDFYVNNINDGADYTVNPDGILAMRMASNGNIGIGTIAPTAKLAIAAESDAAAYWTDAQLHIKGLTDPRMTLSLGYDTISNVGVIQAGQTGVGFKNLCLNANGGNIGIGTINPTQRLSVNGTIRAKEVIVETAGWSDYVFTEDYALQSLAEVEQHIKEHKHLPGIPSNQQVSENGIGLGEMQGKLLAKIEELTLHVIRQQKEIEALQRENSEFRQSRRTSDGP